MRITFELAMRQVNNSRGLATCECCLSGVDLITEAKFVNGHLICPVCFLVHNNPNAIPSPKDCEKDSSLWEKFVEYKRDLAEIVSR